MTGTVEIQARDRRRIVVDRLGHQMSFGGTIFLSKASGYDYISKGHTTCFFLEGDRLTQLLKTNSKVFSSTYNIAMKRENELRRNYGAVLAEDFKSKESPSKLPSLPLLSNHPILSMIKVSPNKDSGSASQSNFKLSSATKGKVIIKENIQSQITGDPPVAPSKGSKPITRKINQVVPAPPTPTSKQSPEQMDSPTKLFTYEIAPLLRKKTPRLSKRQISSSSNSSSNSSSESNLKDKKKSKKSEETSKGALSRLEKSSPPKLKADDDDDDHKHTAIALRSLHFFLVASLADPDREADDSIDMVHPISSLDSKDLSEASALRLIGMIEVGAI